MERADHGALRVLRLTWDQVPVGVWFRWEYLDCQCRYMVVSRRSTGGVRFRWEYLDCQYILCPPVGKRCHYHSSDWLPGHLEIELDPLALELEATFGAQNRIGTVKFWFQRVSARLRSSFAERLRY